MPTVALTQAAEPARVDIETQEPNSAPQEHPASLNDTSSDTNDIREQADQARDPEQGKNII